ncbi:hypothetical protein T484DRAFT_1927451 [Baffinella frigidus]|nr:hypothetical protein T484DRAFT_1927451 [Cryptophyta sp. CCMP2293]
MAVRPLPLESCLLLAAGLASAGSRCAGAGSRSRRAVGRVGCGCWPAQSRARKSPATPSRPPPSQEVSSAYRR